MVNINMKRKYMIQKTEEMNITMHAKCWDDVVALSIDQYPWDENGYKPITEAKLIYNENGIAVLFQSDETEVLARFTGINEPVCKDSCVELFLNPNPTGSADYLNIEVSAAGGILIGKGPVRGNRKDLDTIVPEQFQIEKEIRKDGWALKLFVPFAFLEEQYGTIEKEMGGNLQKCGDDTVHPHFGCWNPIVAPQPDFHRPECFGELVLEA